MSEQKQHTTTEDLARHQEELTAAQAEQAQGGIIIHGRTSLGDTSVPMEEVSFTYSKIK
jgi:hypothetical protein